MSGQLPGSPEKVEILLVDDRPTNLLALKALLERPDYDLVLAESGPDALAQVLRRDFAVVLLDVAMPGMDGFQTASIIKEREQSKRIPIIFITASVYDMEHIFRGYTVGAVDYLRKPVDPHAVRSKVGTFVELYRQRREIERQAAQLREIELREHRLMRERAEEALTESESLYQLTFELAPVGIGHLSPAGVFTRANRRLGEILDGASVSVHDRGLESLAEGDDGSALARALARLRSGAEASYRGEHLLKTARGPSPWVEISVSPFRDPRGGDIREFIVVMNDISARKQAELERSRLVRELEEGVRSRDDFISLAAHELKTPLTPLRLQSSGLLLEAERQGTGGSLPAEKLRVRLASIVRAVDRLGTLVDRLLDVSRLNTGAIRLELHEVDLVAIVRDVVQRQGEDAGSAGCPIAVHAEAPVTGSWDALRIDQIVTNLVSNAVRYGAGKPVSVTVSGDATTARLRVRDQGIGIPADAQERIFERFERAAPVGSYGGFGLGLWIVRLLTEAHGGHIAVSSEVGRGSEFMIELPRRPSPVLSIEAAPRRLSA